MTHGYDGQMPDAGPPGMDAGPHDVQATAPTPRADGSIGSWIERVRGEYREMPGLSLTMKQAERLWGLEPSACRACSTSSRPADSFAAPTAVDTSAPTERNHGRTRTGPSARDGASHVLRSHGPRAACLRTVWASRLDCTTKLRLLLPIVRLTRDARPWFAARVK